MRRPICFSLLCFCLALNQTTAADTAPEVKASQPVLREVTDYVDFTGRTQAVSTVNVVARVTGYVVKEPFKEGSDVKAGALLFEIDPRPYQAQYDQALSQVDLQKAQLKLAQARLGRDEQLGRATPGVLSAQQLDMGLQNEVGFPRKGVADFINNQVNPATGSVLVRGVFANPMLPGGQRMMMPGMFVRCRLPIGQPHKALLVTDKG